MDLDELTINNGIGIAPSPERRLYRKRRLSPKARNLNVPVLAPRRT